ncbi:MAG: TIGR00341 family protein [Pseudomonadota bacterium]
MKVVEVITREGHIEAVRRLARESGASDHWLGPVNEDERQAVRILISPEHRQQLLDALQARLGSSEESRILVYPLEIALPRSEETDESSGSQGAVTTREELYNEIHAGTRLDGTFLLLVFLSTIVATIGLLENNPAVIIGAMVIAPLLGPNLALALGTALGDSRLMWQAFKTGVSGLSLALIISVAIGKLWPSVSYSHEVLSRTEAGLDTIALAFASGAAAVISLTTGLSSVLVGVMVAVALLPPTAVIGMMIGQGEWQLAYGATLLLLINIVSVNLAAKLVFMFKGVKPRTWLEKQQARQSMMSYIFIWILSLILLVTMIYVRQYIG